MSDLNQPLLTINHVELSFFVFFFFDAQHEITFCIETQPICRIEIDQKLPEKTGILSIHPFSAIAHLIGGSKRDYEFMTCALLSKPNKQTDCLDFG